MALGLGEELDSGVGKFPNIHLAPINKINKIVSAGVIQMALPWHGGKVVRQVGTALEDVWDQEGTYCAGGGGGGRHSKWPPFRRPEAPPTSSSKTFS